MPTQRSGSKEVFRQTLVSRAREMRGHLTAAELKLWERLRGDQLLGLRFRRQRGEPPAAPPPAQQRR